MKTESCLLDLTTWRLLVTLSSGDPISGENISLIGVNRI